MDNTHLKEYCDKLKKEVVINNKIIFIKGLQVNLDFFELKVARNRCYFAYPPTGLQYLAQAIEHRDLDVKILDLNYEFLKRSNEDPDFDCRKGMDIFKEYLDNNDASVIGVSNMFNIEVKGFIEILNYLKQRNDKRVIIIGGHNGTYEGKHLLKRGLCHFVCGRESENKINYLFDHLYENENNKPTPDISFVYDGEVKETTGERDIVALKGNLIKAHELVPIENYHKVGTLSPYSRMAGKDLAFATVAFNRGCEAGCKFCGTRDYMGIGVRSRKIEDFLDEVEYLNKVRNIKHFEILDDDFTRYKDKAMEVLDGIIKRGLEMTWSSNNGLIARTIDEELMRKIYESGCTGFKIGVESGNVDMLKKILKPGKLKTFRAFSKIAHEYPDMFIVDNYILGLPDETFGQMVDTLRFGLEMDLDWSQCAVYQHNVNYFGDKEERTDNEISEDCNLGHLKENTDRTDLTLKGTDIFKIPYDAIPSNDQLTEIWFAFNLIRNFMFNKNLLPGGKLQKYINWVGVIAERYPEHPYMNFFLGIANNLIGDDKGAEIEKQKMNENLKDDGWKRKFDQFGMTEIAENFPNNYAQSMESIEFLRTRVLKILNKDTPSDFVQTH
jgi:radical SAM superfamily enzyme YgiQ (UPF0313 family)